jgi:hypothetical protein
MKWIMKCLLGVGLVNLLNQCGCNSTGVLNDLLTRVRLDFLSHSQVLLVHVGINFLHELSFIVTPHALELGYIVSLDKIFITFVVWIEVDSFGSFI